MQPTAAIVGNNIRKARKQKGLSQTELSKLIGKSLRTLQCYESGDSEPSFAMLNLLAKVLDTTTAQLLGYSESHQEINTLADVISFLYALNEKADLRYEIDVKHPSEAGEWSCSIRFSGNQPAAPLNSDLCLFLEEFAEERNSLESYWIDTDAYRYWFDRQLAAYASALLSGKPYEALPFEERIRRRNQKISEEMEKSRKANEP